MMKKIVAFLLLLLPLSVLAQTATVTNFGDMYSTYNLSSADESAIRSAVGQNELNDIKIYARETGWPAGFDELDERSANRDKLGKFKLQYVCDIDGGEKSIVKAPKSLNYHMTGTWALSHDIYFVVRSTSVALSGSRSVSSGSSGAKSVTVTDYEEIYTTYTLTSENENEIRKAVGSSVLADIRRYSHEDEWPSGLQTLDGRNANRSKMYNYNVEYVCSFGDKVVLRVPVSKNSHMASNMRPTGHDMYIIIGQVGVTLSSGSSSSYSSGSSSSGATTVTVNDFGELFSTYSMTAADENDVRGAVGQTMLDEIKLYSQEDTWPSDIATLSARNDNRPKMYGYAVEYICSIDGAVIMRASVADNTHMAYGMRPTSHAIYFIVGTSGVTLDGPEIRGGNRGSGSTTPTGGRRR